MAARAAFEDVLARITTASWPAAVIKFKAFVLKQSLVPPPLMHASKNTLEGILEDWQSGFGAPPLGAASSSSAASPAPPPPPAPIPYPFKGATHKAIMDALAALATCLAPTAAELEADKAARAASAAAEQVARDETRERHRVKYATEFVNHVECGPIALAKALQLADSSNAISAMAAIIAYAKSLNPVFSVEVLLEEAKTKAMATMSGGSSSAGAGAVGAGGAAAGGGGGG